MRKKLLLLFGLMILIGLGGVKAQLVKFDFESGNGGFGTNNATVAQAANPSIDATNGSANALSITRGSGGWGWAVNYYVDPALSYDGYNAVEMLVYAPATSTLQIKFEGGGANPNVTMSATQATPVLNQWVKLTFEIPPGTVNGVYRNMIIDPKADGTFYVDNITFVTLSLPAPTSISLNYDNISLIPAKKVQLEATFLPSSADKTVTYASENTSVADVSSGGIITSLSPGTSEVKIISSVVVDVEDSVAVTVNAADTSISMVYANFENGLTNYDGIWNNWPENKKPKTNIVDNLLIDASNGSDKVLEVDSCFQYAAVVFKPFDINKIDTITFKVLSPTAVADFQLEIALNGGIGTHKLKLPASAGIAANTWVEMKYPANWYQTANKQLYIKLLSNGSKPASTTAGYKFYIDDVTYTSGGISKFIAVTDIAVNQDAITTDDGIIDLSASFTPSIVSNESVTWSLVNASSSISDTAIFTANPPTLKAVRNGSVKVKVTSLDGGYTAEKTITISGQKVPVDSIHFTLDTVNITSSGGTLRVDTIVNVYPADATNKNVVYSLMNDTLNKISASGEVEAFMDGNLWVKAVSDSNANAIDSILVVISNQQKVTEIIVNGAAGAAAIDVNGGALQMEATVNPAEARVKHVNWSVDDPTLASIDENGLLQAMSDGDVVVTATAIDGSGISGNKTITLTNQISVTSVEIVGTHTITEDNVNDTIYAIVLPYNASDRSVNWTLLGSDSPDTAMISVLNDSTVVLTPVRNGAIKLKASPTSKPSLADTIDVAISGQLVPVTGIVVKGMNDSTTIGRNDSTLQMVYTITPADADIQSVTWSLANSTASPDTCTLSASGLLTAVRNGKAIVKATVLSLHNYLIVVIISYYFLAKIKSFY
jgi:hypothetical protein